MAWIAAIPAVAGAASAVIKLFSSEDESLTQLQVQNLLVDQRAQIEAENALHEEKIRIMTENLMTNQQQQLKKSNAQTWDRSVDSDQKQMMEMQYNMIRQQIKQSEESKSQLLDTITTMKENDQKKALIELEKKNKESLKLQKQEFANREKERLAFVKIQSERLEADIKVKHEATQEAFKKKLDALNEFQNEERKKLIEDQKAEDEKYYVKMNGLQIQMQLKELEHAEKLNEMMKIVEKKNYESHFPIPKSLQKHIETYKNSFRIQILGCRGAGKSTFINKLMIKADLGKVAATGCNETTKKTAFYEITSKISKKPKRYERVFICDQPGIGGLEIMEAGYLNKFGPGHFNFTFILGEKGFNELDMSLLKHLLFNKRPLAFVRTKCDSAINGLLDEEYDQGNCDFSFEEALKMLQRKFRNYINTKVLEKVNVDELEIFFVGIPPRRKTFPDFEKIFQLLFTGELLERIGNFEASEL